jgi:hypothetical protein
MAAAVVAVGVVFLLARRLPWIEPTAAVEIIDPKPASTSLVPVLSAPVKK